MNNLLILVLLMALVAYLPRAIPMIWLKNLKLSRFWEGFFRYLPFAMLSALVFPGVFSSCGSTGLSAAGLAAAIALSLFNLNSTVVVMGSVLTVYLFGIL